ncbi:MAG: class I SAM-dependent methyltransferase [Pseudomonadota bacterium]
MSEHPLVALQRTLYESSNPTRRYLHCRRRDWVKNAVLSVPTAKVAMEVGPGSGVYLGALLEQSQLLIAFDAELLHLQSARALPELANSATPVSFIQGDLAAAPIAPCSVDMLLCSEVFEHINPSVPSLSALSSLLSRDGVMIFTTPQPGSLIEIFGRFAYRPPFINLLRTIYKEPIEPTGHINVTSANRLKSAFAAANLQIEQEDYLGFYLPLLAEFGGHWGARLQQRIEGRLRKTFLRTMLWTQCYVVRRKPDSEP